MGTFIKGINIFFGNLPELLRRKKILVVSFIVILTLLLGAGTGRIIINNSLDSFFRDNDPVKKEYDKFKTIFGGDEYIYIVYKAKDGDIFSKKSIAALKGFYDDINDYRLKLTLDETSPLDHIVEIKSLINIKFLEASNDTLYSRSLIGDNLPVNEREKEILRNKALNHPDYPHLFLSKDERYGGILLRTDFNSELIVQDKKTEAQKISKRFDDDDEFEEEAVSFSSIADLPEYDFKKTDMTEYPLLLNALRELMQKQEYSKALEFHPVGKPVLMDFFAVVILKDLGRIMGLVLVLITIMLCVLFRSLSAVTWPLVIIMTTLVWVTGIIGWSGIEMSIMFQIIIFLILAVGIANSVHIMSGYLFFRNKNYPHKEALSAVMKKSGLACLLTSTTTATGLLSLSFVPIKPIIVFGIFSSAGVLTAFILTVILMPLMLDLWNHAPKNTNKKIHLIQRFIQKTETTGPRHSGKVIILFTILGLFFFSGLMKLRIDSNDIEVLKDKLPLKDSYNLVNRYMGGTGNMEISIDLKKEDALKDPEVLYKIEALQKYLKNKPGSKVVKTLSLVNLVKDSHKALNNGDEKFYKIPEDPALLSQTIFLFSNANPTDRRRLVTDDYSQARIGINVKNTGSVEAIAFKKEIQDYMAENFKSLKKNYPDYEVTLTGNIVLIAIMLDYISWAEIKSFGLTLLVISLILFIVFGNFKAGAIAIIPNLFPILTSFGLMGFLDIPLDMDTLLIAPVIIGLAVDDTIHFLTHYKLEIEKTGNITEAAINAIREAGQAICFTSLILASGFFMFILSFHNGLSHFGIFSAIAIITALIADIYLLPALCMFFQVDFKDAVPRRKKFFSIGWNSK